MTGKTGKDSEEASLLNLRRAAAGGRKMWLAYTVRPSKEKEEGKNREEAIRF